MFIATTATRRLLDLNKRIRIIAGGSSAGKTVSILQILIDYAQSTEGELISVVSESFPHLRRGAMRDFLNIMQDQGYFEPDLWSKSEYTYTFETGSKIEFFSADQPGKVRGPRRDVLFVNEVNNIPREAWEQLVIRTRKAVWADFNPVADFFIYQDYEINDEPVSVGAPDTEFCILTYKDNEALEQALVTEIERRAARNKQWGRVYAKGLRGDVEGRIYTGWAILDEIPHEAKLLRRGLDFGFSNDPAALIDVYRYNGGFIFDQVLYQLNLHNREIAEVIKALPEPQTTIYADSSEPKSIDELRILGINIMPAQKGPGSVRQGIDFLQDQRCSVTKRSVDIIKEYRGYMFDEDKDGNQTRDPIDINNHTMDAIRYALETYSIHYNPAEVGIADASLRPRSNESFLVDEDGNALNFQVDLLAAAKASEDKPRDWRYQ